MGLIGGAANGGRIMKQRPRTTKLLARPSGETSLQQWPHRHQCVARRTKPSGPVGAQRHGQGAVIHRGCIAKHSDGHGSAARGPADCAKPTPNPTSCNAMITRPGSFFQSGNGV
ncbi:hypothetical protein SynA1544_00200 [Synechococcus sp. A15-44]|nr:hypothetical protein SynA1544_00200 [Synechococcus sp. A15-44]